MANVKQLLEAVGSQLDQVCKIVIYVTHIDYRDVAYSIVGCWLRGVYPCLLYTSPSPRDRG